MVTTISTMKRGGLIVAGLLLAISESSQAVIVAGANGAGSSNNTTRSQFESATGTSFPNFDNVIPYSAGGTGIYLGYNPGTSDFWVLTAEHIFNDVSNVTIGGTTYTHPGAANVFPIPGSDLSLNRFTTALPLPNLSPVTLASSSPIAGEFVAMMGRGRQRAEAGSINPLLSDATDFGGGDSGYTWTSDRVMRWGTNNVANSPDGVVFPFSGPGIPGTQVFSTVFDEPGLGEWTTSNEAQGSGGDSGGGVFTLSGTGEWELSGIFSAADAYSADGDIVSVFDDSLESRTYITDIATFRDEIDAITGTLVPEPTSIVLVLIPSGLLLRRRR